MPVNPTGLRRRRGRIEESRPQQTRQKDPTSFGGTGLIPVVIRSTEEEVEQGTMMVQRIRYSDRPPVVGQLEGIGQRFRAYPYWAAEYYQYAAFAWGPDDPITTMAYPFMAMQDHGDWVLIMPLKVAGSVLDPDDPKSGCSG